MIKVDADRRKYDYDTKVMYYIWDGYNKIGISPIYNSDGSVMIYEGE